MRVGTASQPASIASESEAAHGEMERLHNEISRLKKEAAKKEKNMEKLARYAFDRCNILAAEAKEFARLYAAARSNCKEGVTSSARDGAGAGERTTWRKSVHEDVRGREYFNDR